MEVPANVQKVFDDLDPEVAQVVGIADAGEHQELGRPDDPTRQDHLRVHVIPPDPAFVLVFHPDAPASLEQEAPGGGPGGHREVRPVERRVQEGHGGALSLPVLYRDVAPPHAFHVRPIEVLGVGKAQLLPGLDRGLGNWAGVLEPGDVQRAADPVVIGRAELVVLGFLEVFQNRPGVPSDVALVRPVIVVAVVAADVDHGVDRAAAPERLAARPRAGSPGGVLLRHGHIRPIAVGLPRSRPSGGVVDVRILVRAVRLQQEHPRVGVFREPARDHAPRRADDHVVVPPRTPFLRHPGISFPQITRRGRWADGPRTSRLPR